MITIKHIARLTLPLLLILTACQGKVKRPQPLPQDPLIQVYFNHNQAAGADYTEPYRQITRPGDDLEAIIITAIEDANATIDMAVQELNLPKIAQALVKKQQAGVQVRVILENQYNDPLSEFTPEKDQDKSYEFFVLADTNKDGVISQEEINQNDALIILKNGGVPLIDDTADGSKGSNLMHHKFIVIDNKKVITGSVNFTTSDIHGDFANPENRGNANNLLTINDAHIANIFTEEFNLIWGDGPGGQPDSKFGLQKPYRPPQQVTVGETTITVLFSPISPTQPWSFSGNGLIEETLTQATQSVDLALFVFSEQKIADSLENLQQQGVEVRALIDPHFAFQYYSEGLDLLGVALSNKCKYEPDNNPWEKPAIMGIPELPAGDKLHHKFGVIDEATVITGSHNWSAAANHSNDETLLVIENPIIAAHYRREWARLFQGAELGVSAKVRDEIQQEEANCPQISSSTAVEKNNNNSVVNINTATQEELEQLPGIGPTLAGRIIEERQKQPFTSFNDLQRVSGIGPGMVEKLEGKVSW